MKNSQAGGGGGRDILSRTGQLVHVFGAGKVVASAHLPHELIAGGENDHTEERDQKAKGRVDVPSTENDTEVRRVPSE